MYLCGKIKKEKKKKEEEKVKNIGKEYEKKKKQKRKIIIIREISDTVERHTDKVAKGIGRPKQNQRKKKHYGGWL